MAKEKSSSSEKREKKEKKAKSEEKLSTKNGVHKPSSKKEKKPAELTEALAASLEGSEGGIEMNVVPATRLQGALVPFANPLADEKVGKKVLKSVKKCEDDFLFSLSNVDWGELLGYSIVWTHCALARANREGASLSTARRNEGYLCADRLSASFSLPNSSPSRSVPSPC